MESVAALLRYIVNGEENETIEDMRGTVRSVIQKETMRVKLQ